MIKIVWLAPYNIFRLLPEIEINRNVVLHNASWIHNLSEAIALCSEIELHIITHSQLVNQTQHINKNGIHFHVIKYTFPFTKRGFPGYFPIDKLTGYFAFSRKAVRVINEIQPDIIHVHGTEGGYSLPALKTNIPCIISIQGIITEYNKIDPSFVGYLQTRFEQNAIKKGKYFGCRTNFDFDFVKRLNKSAVIFDLPEAINKIFFEYQWKEKTKPTLLFIGSILKQKGIMDLIYALNELKFTYPFIKLKMIGMGPAKIKRYFDGAIDKFNLRSNVTWLGVKSPEEVARELEECSFFVLPSLMENSPNSLAEAMAVGVPSIATKVGGIPSMITDRYDGMLYEKGDVKELVNIIRTLIADVELQNKLSTNARIKTRERNYPDNVAKKYFEVYKSLIK